LDDPRYYINRELSWLEFNGRVLEEANDKTNLLFERLKFLAIASNNLDEFFMVRVSGLMDQVVAEFSGKDATGLSAKAQLMAISAKVHEMCVKQNNCLTRSLLPALEKQGFYFLQYKELSKGQKSQLKDYFFSTVFPILTPMAIDQSRPFPLLNNKSLNLIIELKGEEENLIALMQVPTVIPRIIELAGPEPGKKEYFLLESLIKKYINALFEGHDVLNVFCFRVTRNSYLDIDEEDSEDLLKEIEDSIKRRKWGYPVRLEVEKKMSPHLVAYLKKNFELDPEDIYEIQGPLDHTLWFSFINQSGCDEYKNPLYIPAPLSDFEGKGIFDAIREKDILVHHPYESFDCVINFVNAAANDEKVLAIKQTLYRVSGNSPIVSALIKAAEKGKQVTVLVELKARFDEENNIVWARKLEKAGCHVVYGLVGLKTHCKACLVVRKESGRIMRYVHLGTGNYNDSTAKIYTDIGYFTSKETFGQDISTLFNLLTGYSTNYKLKKIAVAPITLRKQFEDYIDNEIRNKIEGAEGLIIAKMNSLVDKGIIKKLYLASQAGVKIKLIVRGICCLRPGVQGISENIEVFSIVDRYLEHSRIFYFANNKNPFVLLSSADWMPRNLNRRVEISFHIEDKALKNKIMDILNITLSDTVKLRSLQADGTYIRIDRRGKEFIQSQVEFIEKAMVQHNRQAVGKEEKVFTPIYQTGQT
jgi:polyphosphate kinase